MLFQPEYSAPAIQSCQAVTTAQIVSPDLQGGVPTVEWLPELPCKKNQESITNTLSEDRRIEKMCVLRTDISPLSLVRKAATRPGCETRNGQGVNLTTKTNINDERTTIMKTNDFTKNSIVDFVPLGQFCSGDVVGNGTFHGGDEVSQGSFHGGDEVSKGGFHSGDEIPSGTFHC